MLIMAMYLACAVLNLLDVFIDGINGRLIPQSSSSMRLLSGWLKH
ncbi:hypothetical protein [Candidatus Scalindua japonica]|nr:hypothetical protein [Candidatus Scalindua japonica]